MLEYIPILYDFIKAEMEYMCTRMYQKHLSKTIQQERNNMTVKYQLKTNFSSTFSIPYPIFVYFTGKKTYTPYN